MFTGISFVSSFHNNNCDLIIIIIIVIINHNYCDFTVIGLNAMMSNFLLLEIEFHTLKKASLDLIHQNPNDLLMM